MSTLTLELITDQSIYTSGRSVVLELAQHVHNRIERFRYLDDISNLAVALDYVESPRVLSTTHLQVSNRTYGIVANSDSNAEVRKDWITTTSASLSSEYKTIAVTNKIGLDAYGERRPLFYKHVLPTGTTQCKLEIVSDGNVQKVDGGYDLDLDAGELYTNYQNFFDPATGAYVLYFLTCTTASGTTYELLDPVPTVREATWEDIDLTTGALKTGVSVYSVAQNSSGYTFYFSHSDTWYWRPVEKSLIQPRAPGGREGDEPWYMRFTAGEVNTVVNDSARRYYVPEFDQQNYSPSKPYMYSPYERMQWVNSKVVAATRKNLAIDPDSSRHMTLFIYDYENTLLRVLTTDSSLDGSRYSNTDVFYEGGQIHSWDNSQGIVSLGVKVQPGYQLYAQHHYEADDYEYSLVDLNPINNPFLRDKLVVFYMIPGVNTSDRAIHHLVVDQSGTILDCSQGLGIAHPNLQQFESDGKTVNVNSIIGTKYSSDIETSTFLSNYTAGYDNTNAYGILAEVVVLDRQNIDDMHIYDVRAQGGRPRDDQFSNVIRSNPRILQSVLGYGLEGQEIPKNKVMVVRPPLSLLEDYGGDLTKEKAELLLRSTIDSTALPVFDWVYPAPEITVDTSTAEQVSLSWTWEGPNLTYKLYRSENRVGNYVEIYSVSGGASPSSMSYVDLDVSADDVQYYTVRVQDGTVLYPSTYKVAVKVSP